MAKRYKLAIVGGTFDHFHKGHEALLSKAFKVADGVLVGVTDEKMAGKKQFPAAIESFSERKKSVVCYLAKSHRASHCKIVKIHDAFGPASVWKKADAIVVTAGTVKGALAINSARKKEGLAAAAIVVCPFAVAKDGRRISSTAIRLGQMNRAGEVFLSGKRFAKALSMPQSASAALRKPFGVLFSGPNAARKAIAFLKKQKPVFVATVGDATFRNLSKMGVTPGLAIVDAFEMRAPCRLPENIAAKGAVVSNPAGKVTHALVAAIKESIGCSLSGGKPAAIVVRGEEDLAVLPVVLALPLNSVVLYGQPKKGMVAVVVNEKTKTRASAVLSKFK